MSKLKEISLHVSIIALFFTFLFAVPGLVRTTHAQTYNCGAYGVSAYGSSGAVNADCEPLENLENTGSSPVPGMAIGGLIVLLGVMGIVFTRHRRSKPASSR